MSGDPRSEQLYDELVVLSEVSLELVRDSQFEALQPVHDACRALVAKLPPAPPPSAAAALERVAALDLEKRRLIEHRLGLARDVLVKIQRGRSALGGYVPGQARAAHARVDRTG